jgi:hypothetical protein
MIFVGKQFMYSSIRCFLSTGIDGGAYYTCKGTDSGRGLYPRLSSMERDFMIQYIALQHVRRGNRIQHEARFKPSVNYTESKKGFNWIL